MKKCFTLIMSLVIVCTAYTQTRYTKKENGFPLTMINEIKCSNVKNQFQSGTCWSFSTASFFESELMRMNKGEIDLSEMFVVRKMYELKASNYLRMMGKTNFGAGGEATDVLKCIREFGIVPQSAYTGNTEQDMKPRHNEMDNILEAMVSAAIRLPNGKLSTSFPLAFNNVLDAYLGVCPATFEYNGKTYNPKSFANFIGINPDDYVAITSFTHHPFYQKFILEVPDNWSNESYYNVTIDDLEEIIDHALATGYSVSWSSDVSEKGFSFKNGLAIVPNTDIENSKKEDMDSLFNHPVQQKVIDQQARQIAFDNLSTQDDHGMHIIGSAKDALGQKYYLVKNSWGTEKNDLEGFFFASAAYIRYKTTGILLHKNALAKSIHDKLSIN